MPRVAEHPIEPQFLRRWSPRAMSGTPVTLADLHRLLEAARWAPSSGNVQPWRFAYALAGGPHFSRFFEALEEGNQVWCARPGALLVVASQLARAPGKPNPTHAFDAGAAWMSFALQGSSMGLVVHAMAGFDDARARAAAGVPPELHVNCMIAVKHPNPMEELPERLRPRETPSGRNPISAFAFDGRF